MGQLNEIMDALARNPGFTSKQNDLAEYISKHDPVQTLQKLKLYIAGHDKGNYLYVIKNFSPKVTEEKAMLLDNIKEELLAFIKLSYEKFTLLMEECNTYLSHLEADVKRMLEQHDYELYKKVFEENNKGEVGGLGVLLGYHDQLDENRKPVVPMALIFVFIKKN